MKSLQIIALLSFFICNSCILFAQNIPVGTWRTHLPFHQAVSLTTNGEAVIVATTGGVLFYHIADNSVERLSTVNGLSGTNVSVVQFDSLNQQLLIGYNNLNIDIYKNGNVINFPAIKNSGITGEKRLNDIYLKDNLAYVSGTFGIVIIDFVNNVVIETYSLSDGSENIEVYNVAEDNQKLIAATEKGIFEARISNPRLFDVREWKQHDTLKNNIKQKKVNQVTYDNDHFYCLQDSIIYRFDENKWKPYYTAAADQQIRHFAFNNHTLYVSELRGAGEGRVLEFIEPDTTAVFTNYSIRMPEEIRFFNESVWVADNWEGLNEITSNEIKNHRPSAPRDESIYAFTVDNNNNIWVAAGSAPANFDSNISYSSRGAYRFDNFGWINKNTYNLNNPQLLDVLSVAVHPETGITFMGTYIYGLFSFDGDDVLTQYDELNSSLERSAGNEIGVIDMAFDRNNNLWMSNIKTDSPIKLLTNQGEWKAFKPNFNLPTLSVTEILVTEFYNQVWVVVDRKGILVYDYGEDIIATSDDQYIFLDNNAGNGNLPNQQVYAMAEDNDGEIWVGTSEGIGIFFCPNSLFDPEGCDAFLPIVQIDEFPGPLLESDVINCITVDKADRKWIGTGNGVWLLGEDGKEIIHRFTEANSPLPANEIKDIAINESTGEVFIGTSKGIVSYRGSASTGQISYNAVRIFPNPVEPGYKGNITIQNLVGQSTVKITDVSGNLVYETQSLGGQVVWDGADYTGRKVGSGVYLVLATNDDGSQGFEGKIMIVR